MAIIRTTFAILISNYYVIINYLKIKVSLIGLNNKYTTFSKNKLEITSIIVITDDFNR